MNQNIIEYWNMAKEIIKDIALYIIPIAAFIVSVIALKRSNKCLEIRVQLSEVEQKLQEYELAIKEYELHKIFEKENQEKAKAACIQARIYNISKNKYRLKIWNSGNLPAYNIIVDIPVEYGIILSKDKMPFEYLNPGKSFEEHVLIYVGASPKFKIMSTWENQNGEKFTNEQIESW